MFPNIIECNAQLCQSQINFHLDLFYRDANKSKTDRSAQFLQNMKNSLQESRESKGWFWRLTINTQTNKQKWIIKSNLMPVAMYLFCRPFVLALVWWDSCLQHADPEKDFLRTCISATHDNVVREECVGLQTDWALLFCLSTYSTDDGASSGLWLTHMHCYSLQ